jgi:hypothetical protein
VPTQAAFRPELRRGDIERRMIKSRQFKDLLRSPDKSFCVFQGGRQASFLAALHRARTPAPDDQRYKRQRLWRRMARPILLEPAVTPVRVAPRCCMAHTAQRDVALIIHGVSR